jgi:hypothetical protein
MEIGVPFAVLLQLLKLAEFKEKFKFEGKESSGEPQFKS